MALTTRTDLYRRALGTLKSGQHVIRRVPSRWRPPDPDPHSHEARIGQVLNQKAPRVSLTNASVMLWTEKGLVLAETKTNGHPAPAHIPAH